MNLLTKDVIPGPELPLGGFWKEEEGMGEPGGALASGHNEWGFVWA